MLSFWESQSFIHYDFIIIGSGIVGLSTAISIKEKFPEKTILILERGIFPTGASTRNAGFTTFGGVSELLNDLKTMSPEAVFNLVVKRREGLQMLLGRLGKDIVDYQNLGGYEFVFNNESIEKNDIERINGLLYPLFKDQVFSINNSIIQSSGFNKNFIKYCIATPFEGQLDTGKMMQALLRMALKSGIEIKTGAEVLQIETTQHAVEIEVKNPVSNNRIIFKADQCILCTNAFTGRFFPEMDIIPGRGQVLVTEPLDRLPFKGIFHFDAGYYYFRNIGNRILFGGGRNLDFENEKTTNFALNDGIQQKLDYYLQNLIIPKYNYTVAMRWSGIMAFGKEKTPIVKRINERILAGVRMNGIGVSLASKVADELAEML